MSYVTVGVDPGITAGGIACLVGDELHSAVRLPTYKERVNGKNRNRLDLDALRLLLDEYAALCPPATTPVMVVEKQQPRQGEGTVSSFSTGYGFAAPMCLALGMGWGVSVPTAKEWQEAHGIVKADKSLSVEMAATLWPAHRSSFYGPRGGELDGPAEAALIGAAFGLMVAEDAA